MIRKGQGCAQKGQGVPEQLRSAERTNALLMQFQREHKRTLHSSLKYRTTLQVYRAKQKPGLIWAPALPLLTNLDSSLRS